MFTTAQILARQAELAAERAADPAAFAAKERALVRRQFDGQGRPVMWTGARKSGQESADENYS